VNVAVYFAQILKIFAQIMAKFSALGMRPHLCIPVPYADVCVLCKLVVYFMGGKLVFDCDQLEDFLITRNGPVGNKITNTISYAKVEYHMCKYSAPSPLMHRQKATCLLCLHHDCHAIICRASLWSATAIGIK